MGNNNLSKEHREIVKKPFVFISYCWEDPNIVIRVKNLATTLRNNGISVLYDEGGMEPGENSRHFEYQIFNENCKLVLVSSDQYYAERIKACIGGVNDEFNHIITDYNENPLKYIPLYAGAIIPLFKGKIRFNFMDESDFNRISDFCRKKTENKSNQNNISKKEKKKKIEELFESADKLYDKDDYRGALSKLERANNLCKTGKYAKQQIRILHRKLNVYIKEGNGKKAVETSDEIEKMIPKNCDALNKATYYGNFALAHRLVNKKSENYENYAHKAYDCSKKIDDPIEKEYFARLYKSALLETEQYCDAYDKASEALELFKIANPIEKDYTIEQFTEYFELICDLAEAAMFCSTVKTKRKDKTAMLLCSELNLWEAISRIPEIDDETKKAEAYRIVALVASELHNHYSN